MSDVEKDKLIKILKIIGYISILKRYNILRGISYNEHFNCVCISVVSEYLGVFTVHELYLTNFIDVKGICKELEEIYHITLPQNHNVKQYDVTQKYCNGDLVQDLSGDYLIYVNGIWQQMF